MIFIAVTSAFLSGIFAHAFFTELKNAKASKSKEKAYITPF